MKICEPKAGETIVVSAASGAVGSVVGQLAKARGCRAVGIAGGAEKCALRRRRARLRRLHRLQGAPRSEVALRGAEGRDARTASTATSRTSAALVLDAALARMNAFGRIALCGMISGYNGEPIPLQQPQLLLQSRLRIEGFIVSEHMEVWPRGAEGARHAGRDRQAEVPRDDRAGHRVGARGVPRPAEGPQLRQAARQAGLSRTAHAASTDDRASILHHYATSPFSEKVRLVLGLKRLRVAIGDGAGDAAEARRHRADRRLPAHAVHADRRRHLLRLGADVPRDRPPRAAAAALSGGSAGVARASSRNGPTRRCSGPRCRTRCSRPARRTSSAARRPSTLKAFARRSRRDDRRHAPRRPSPMPARAAAALPRLARAACWPTAAPCLIGAEP